MTFTLPLPDDWAKQGWKARIRSDERTEEPHVTVMRRTFGWRISLRTGELLDSAPDPREVPPEVLDEVWRGRRRLRLEWDQRCPENPVFSIPRKERRT